MGEVFGIIGFSMGGMGLVGFVFALIAQNRVAHLEKVLKEKGILDTSDLSQES